MGTEVYREIEEKAKESGIFLSYHEEYILAHCDYYEGADYFSEWLLTEMGWKSIIYPTNHNWVVQIERN